MLRIDDGVGVQMGDSGRIVVRIGYKIWVRPSGTAGARAWTRGRGRGKGKGMARARASCSG